MAMHGRLWNALTKQRKPRGLRVEASLVIPEIIRNSVCVDWNKFEEKW